MMDLCDPSTGGQHLPPSGLDYNATRAQLQQVLCGNRVSQMTKTYNDIDAVTKLLEEKETDLELAALIGKQLVCRNRALEDRQSTLELELTAAADASTQLQHQLTLKTNLLSIYTDDVDDSSCDATPVGMRHVSVDLLQQKVRTLQDDNIQLRAEATQLAEDTTECEEREDCLMHDVIKQLDTANQQVLATGMELRQKNDESLKQHEEATLFLAQIVDLQARLKESYTEQQELREMVGVSRECQQELTVEIAELKEQYAEVMDLLHDSQEQLRRYTKKNHGVVSGRTGGRIPVGGAGMYSSPYLGNCGGGGDSIASELSSLNATPPPPLSFNSISGHYGRVFDTVKSSSRPLPSSHASSSYTPGYTSYTPGYNSFGPGYTDHTPSIATYNTNSNRTGYTPQSNSSYRSSVWDSGTSSGVGGLCAPGPAASGHLSLDSGADSDMHTDTEDYPASAVGVPGYPGSPDLASCLRRIPTLSSSSFTATNISLVASSMPSSSSVAATTPTASQPMPYGFRTPDSIMATGGGSSQHMSVFPWSSSRMAPSKLQIIKPMEGSMTLHHWSRLAKHDLSGVFQPHSEGIAMRGTIGNRGDLKVYSLSDLEEDEEVTTSSEEPRKQFLDTSAVYTFTNSVILHVDENTQPTSARTGVNMSFSVPSNTPNMSTHFSSSTTTTVSTSNSSSSGGQQYQPSSLPPSRRNSTATFSTHVGLARVLQERGVATSGATSGAAAPYTATPANSPEGSCPGTPVPGYYALPSLRDLRSGLAYGASMLRRTLLPSPPSSPLPLSPGPLYKTVAACGLQLMPPHHSHHSVGGVVAPRPVPPSPLLHLSNLIRGTTPIIGAECYSELPSPELSSPGTRRPPMPYNAPLGVPAQPGMGELDSLPPARAGALRRDLGTVPRPPPAAARSRRGEMEKMGALGVMSVGRKGGLL